MAHSWRPHGIITDPGLEMPYREAKLSVDSQGNELDPKEHATVHLFENVFNRVLFADGKYYVNSQVPPASKRGSEKACDLAIKSVAGNLQHSIFCFAEAKRARNTTHAKINDLEKQAFGYCVDHLSANSDVNFIYAGTLVGAAVRCWSLHRGDESLRPFWGDYQSSYAQYLDIGDESNRETLQGAFHSRRSIPMDGVMPLGMEHGDIGRINPGMAAFGVATNTVTWDNVGNTQTPMPYPSPAGRAYPLESSAQPPLLSFAADMASTVRRATPEEQTQLMQANYVDVSVSRAGRTMMDTTYQLKTKSGRKLEKKGKDFEQVICSTDNGDQYCWIYIGKVSHTFYWTWTLDVDKKGKYIM